jgi:hypothetical protein
MKTIQRRVMHIIGLVLASAALGRPPLGDVEACSNCTSPILCEGNKYTGYVSCEVNEPEPCKVNLPVCKQIEG